MENKQLIFNIFCSHYLPSLGGVEKYTYNFSKELTKLGFRVNIITTNTHNSNFYEKNGNINIFRLNVINLLGKRFPVPYSIFQLLEINKKCFTLNKTVSIIHTRLYPLSLIGTVLAKISNSTTFVLEHGSGHFVYNNWFLNWASHSYEHLITKFIFLLKPTFFGVSKECNKWLKHFNIPSKGILPNGVDYKCSFRKDLEIKKINPKNKKIIFYGGRLIKEKGILELIRGFQQFVDLYPNYVLILAGWGELEKEIKKISQTDNRVIFLGKISQDEVFSLLSQSFIFVNPSNYPEGLPTVLLEAGKFALPTISTPNGGAKEIIISRRSGIIINHGTSKNIYKSLLYMETHPKEAINMGKNLQKIVKEGYNWPMIISNFISSQQLNI